MNPPSVQPRRLHFMLGGYPGGYTHLTYADGETRCHHDGFTERRHKSRVPSDAEWLEFWDVVEEAGVWTWIGTYDADGILDSLQWRLEIAREDRHTYCSGSNAYPPTGQELEMTPEFRDFVNAVSKLTRGYFRKAE